MKKYFIYSLKRYIPLFVVSFAVCFFTLISTFGGSIPTKITYYSESGYSYINELLSGLSINSGLIFLLVPVTIFTILLPFFANSYRYSLQSADTFYQIGKNKKSIRWANNLILLVAFLASFSVAYFFAVAILFFRQLPNIGRPDEVVQVNQYTEQVTHYLFFNFGYYIPAYFVILIYAVLNYAISYFLVTRANNLVNSILMLIIGQGILAVGLMTPFWFLLVANTDFDGSMGILVDESLLLGTRTACFVSPIAFIIYLFDGLITQGTSGLVDNLTNVEYNSAKVFGVVMSFLCLLVFIGVAAFGIYKFLTEKESSGEFAGKPAGRDMFQTILFHTGFGILGLWIGTLQSLLGISSLSNGIFIFILLISEMGFYSAGYYVLNGLLNRNFRTEKRELFMMIGIVATNFVIGLTLLIASTITYMR